MYGKNRGFSLCHTPPILPFSKSVHQASTSFWVRVFSRPVRILLTRELGRYPFQLSKFPAIQVPGSFQLISVSSGGGLSRAERHLNSDIYVAPAAPLDPEGFRGYGRGMDKASALKILGLGPDATEEEAKKRFRELAKSFHPDRFARDSRGAEAAETRMKEINTAFHFLGPLLPDGSVPKQRSRPQSRPKEGRQPRPEKKGFFSSMRRRWRQKSSSTVSRPKPTRANASHARAKSPGARGNRPGSSKFQGFDSLLNAMVPGQRPSAGKKTGKGRPIRPYDNYRRYMDVKKRIQRSRQSALQTGIGRVEKIRPVQRVNPVGDD